jgi:hypothetical protein
MTALFAGQLGVKAAQADCKGLEGWQWVTVVHCEHILGHLPKLQDHLFVLRRRHWGSLWWGWCSSSGRRSGNKLEVLDRRNCHSAPKIEAPALQLLMPPWGLVSENQWSLLALVIVSQCSVSNPVAAHWDFRESCAAETHRMVHNRWLGEGNAAKWLINGASKDAVRLAWNSATSLKAWGRDGVHNTVHPPRAPSTQDIQLIWNLCYVVGSGRDLWRHLPGVEPTACFPWLWCIAWRLGIIYCKLCAEEIWPRCSIP